MKPYIPKHKEEKGHSLWHKSIKKEESLKVTIKSKGGKKW